MPITSDSPQTPTSLIGFCVAGILSIAADQYQMDPVASSLIMVSRPTLPLKKVTINELTVCREITGLVALATSATFLTRDIMGTGSKLSLAPALACQLALYISTQMSIRPLINMARAGSSSNFICSKPKAAAPQSNAAAAQSKATADQPLLQVVATDSQTHRRPEVTDPHPRFKRHPAF
jgi:hypothetical protein